MAVGNAVCVTVGVGSGIGVAVAVGNAVLVGMGMVVAVGNGVLVSIGVAVAVGNGVLVGMGMVVAVGNGVLVGMGVAVAWSDPVNGSAVRVGLGTLSVDDLSFTTSTVLTISGSLEQPTAVANSKAARARTSHVGIFISCTR